MAVRSTATIGSFFGNLGIRITQELLQNDIVNSRATQCPTKTEIANEFSALTKLEKWKITQ